ncbi:HNH endonuclease, partial [Streptococcus pluranimalium]|uniref:HNH endonuclease n=1 Tax=Streptococcus pluranimalium TaxID=82348 RepID=UPI003BF91864
MSYIRNLYKTDYRAFIKLPVRRQNVTEKYSNFTQRATLKDYLKEDFYHRCIYCGWSSSKYGGEVFHIEHIKSQDSHPELKDNYDNLALSCSICNTSKGNKEFPDELNPISEKFQSLFYRNKMGAIVVNNLLNQSDKKLSNQCLNIIGLYKELYKLDYIYESLSLIKDKLCLTRESS